MISIVVPVYNVEKYIENCLKSIVNQDYANFELILVDDGSDDNSVVVIKNFLKNKNINWKLITKENGGLSSSRNAGLDVASGEYITFIDSDDVVANNYLSSLKAVIDDNDCDFAFCGYKFVRKQEAPTSKKNSKYVYNTKDLLSVFLKRTINFVVPSMLFKRDYLVKKEIRFDETVRFSEDQMFIWNVIVNSKKSIYLSKEMYGYYIREKSIMTSSSYDTIIKAYDTYIKFTSDIIKKHNEYKDILKFILPRWELGTLYTAAKLISYDDFLRMYKQMDCNKVLLRIMGIGEIKAYLLSCLAMLSPRLMYSFCRKAK